MSEFDSIRVIRVRREDFDRLCRDAGQTQMSCMGQLGVSNRDYMRSMVNGADPISFNMACRMAGILHCSVTDFTDIDEVFVYTVRADGKIILDHLTEMGEERAKGHMPVSTQTKKSLRAMARDGLEVAQTSALMLQACGEKPLDDGALQKIAETMMELGVLDVFLQKGNEVLRREQQ